MKYIHLPFQHVHDSCLFLLHAVLVNFMKIRCAWNFPHIICTIHGNTTDMYAFSMWIKFKSVFISWQLLGGLPLFKGSCSIINIINWLMLAHLIHNKVIKYFGKLRLRRTQPMLNQIGINYCPCGYANATFYARHDRNFHLFQTISSMRWSSFMVMHGLGHGQHKNPAVQIQKMSL